MWSPLLSDYNEPAPELHQKGLTREQHEYYETRARYRARLRHLRRATDERTAAVKQARSFMTMR